ncbi:hypothetical protein [Halopseudomonas pertucinogena]|uniref:LTD domain-containing protein n=1 Tax=Halopseudomonas pertucinogena TaxID=86175 RepID=A0ABQ2CS60_9GAMM|nr:hypothetical protein [Halopseudomonas pertucinogena]GGJ06727.1 hypothetical protein GCM10009083_24660 [Halopseudomonas pertucinogena]
MSAELYIAYWGAGLSTLLALLKLWEYWQHRFRLDVSYRLTGNEYEGNQIFIRNLSDRPIILDHWELSYVKGRWFWRKLSPIATATDPIQLRIEPCSSATFDFREENHFGWSAAALKGRRICIKLYVVGRKPRLKTIYP